MNGKIVSINISKKKGTGKHPVKSGIVNLIQDFGIENDSHAKKGWIRQVSLLSLSSFNKMKSDKLNLKFGAFGENIDVSGVDVYKLPIGAKFLFNNGIELELTKIGKECHDKCAIYETVGDCVMPREGVFVRINKPGKLEVGQEFKVVFNDN
jgi:MOSC domain-containing protein YiiM